MEEYLQEIKEKKRLNRLVNGESHYMSTFIKNWNLLKKNYSVKDICLLVNFNEAMRLVEHPFFDDIKDDENQQFALKLMHEIKNHFKDEWEKDWKNDVFLGKLCSFLWLYDERYFCYKRAYEKLENPPAALLLLLSGCNSAPGIPPITDEVSEYYLRRSLEKEITYEAALKMKNIYERNGNKSQADYWQQKCKEIRKGRGALRSTYS